MSGQKSTAAGSERPADESRSTGAFGRLLDMFPEDIQDEIQAMCTYRCVQSGDVVLEDGEEPDRLGYVLDGLLGMVKTLPDGRRHIIGLLAPTDMYGRLFDGPAHYRIEALSPARIVTLDRGRFEALLRRAPAAERLFLVSMLDELDAAREWVLVLGGTKVVQRVSAFLLILCRRQLRARRVGQSDDREPITLRLAIRRADLAHFLGARPESLSRAFHHLQDQGVLRIVDPHEFDILDIAALVDVAGHDLVMDDTPPAHHGHARG